ncbi:MAG: hypothetical protein ACFFB3_18055 [Candidatus Hodarchaeota archaeon]
MISKVHLNYVTSAPILEFLIEPKAVHPIYSFFTNLDDYVERYRTIFLQSHRRRIGRNTVVRQRSPFLKGLGQLETLSGHEVRNLPMFRSMGGNISYVLGYLKQQRGMIPMKLLPKWKIRLAANTREKGHLLKDSHGFSCNPLIKIYPFGIVTYQIRVYLRSEEPLSIDSLISLMKDIQENPILNAINKGKFSATSLTEEFHSIVLSNIVKDKCTKEDYEKKTLHRILTINEMENGANFLSKKRELAAMNRLEFSWEELTDSYAEKNAGKGFVGKWNGQFFNYHPACTILGCHVVKFKKPEWESFLKKCLRKNFTSIVEATTVQSKFADACRKRIERLRRNSAGSKEEGVESPLLSKIKHGEWLLERRLYSQHFHNEHQVLYKIIDETTGLEKKLKEVLRMLEPPPHRFPGGFTYITPDEFHELIDLVIECGVATEDGREALLIGVNAGFRTYLRTAKSPADQIESDLRAMNRVKYLEGFEVPLKIWLENAVHRLRRQRLPQWRLFEETLEQVTIKSDRIIQKAKGSQPQV